MATNNLLTPLEITRESLRVLHQKLTFVGSVNKQYDSRFAQDGAKIGTQLNIRMPAKYTTTTTTANLTAQNYVERSTPLFVSNQYHVDTSFSSLDLTMSLDDFRDRVIEPAMAQMAASIESAAATIAYQNTFNLVGATNTSMTYLSFQQGGMKLSQQLAPSSQRTAHLNPFARVQFSDAVKGLFQSSDQIASQYREGLMGRTGGFDVYENTLIPSHTSGTYTGAGLTTGTTIGLTGSDTAWASSTTLNIDGATSGQTFKAGDVVTFGTLAAGMVSVQPESKTSYGALQQFVVLSDATVVTAGTVTITVAPAIISGSGNAYQNVLNTKGDTDNMTVTAVISASTSVQQSLQVHKDAFVFATADLVDVSKFGAWGARAVQDGISMRIARQYAIGTDTVPCRIDVLWGFAPLYNQLACRNINPAT